MPEFEKTTFEFPDEKEQAESTATKELAPPKSAARDETEIEIIDDTPPADRNRKPMAEAPKDMTEEELDKYDESVKKRIQHFTKGYHEERRAKDSALREREEAVRMAQALVEENKKLKGSLSQGQTALLEQAKKVVANDLEQAKRRYREAYEAGDSEALANAQEEMTAVKIKAERVNNFKPTSLQDDQVEVQTPKSPPEQRSDPRADDWRDSNPWFGTNRKMTAYAIALHEDLVQDERVSPASEDYFRRIDEEMRSRFPDQFESERSADASPQRQKSNVVAPATRSTAPRKVVLTKSQVEIAKRLNVPLELYARKVAEEMRK